MHEMRFAQTHTAIEKERVKGHLLRLGDTLRGGKGKLVGDANHKVLKGIALIERVAAAKIAQRNAGLGAFRFRGSGYSRRNFWRCSGCSQFARSAQRRLGLGRPQTELDPYKAGQLCLPGFEQLIGVVSLVPVAHEAAGGGQAQAKPIVVEDGERLEPGPVG